MKKLAKKDAANLKFAKRAQSLRYIMLDNKPLRQWRIFLRLTKKNALYHFLHAVFSKAGSAQQLGSKLKTSLSNQTLRQLAPQCYAEDGFAGVLNNGLKPEIMLVIDFPNPFCATFWTSKK